MAAEMTLNKTTMLYSSIPRETREEMLNWCADVVLKGNVTWNHDWLSRWLVECGFDEHQRLLVISTVAPQRLLLSLLLDRQSVDREEWARQSLSEVQERFKEDVVE